MMLEDLVWGYVSPTLSRSTISVSINPLDDIIIWRNERDSIWYMISSRRIEPRRDWFHLDAITAQCVIYELTKHLTPEEEKLACN